MYIVILAGGSGTRFWPLSRTALPKQLISITGDRTMLQRTIDRVLPLQPKRVLIVTNALQADETERQVAGYKGIPIDVIAEPAARNTAPAVALAATIIARHDPAGVMAVLPADHFIRNEDELRRNLGIAARSARNGYLVTLGIVPTCPETGYGYIEADMELRGDEGPFPVQRFVEKPPYEVAVEYFQKGNYFWNSGMFVWRADVILGEIGRHTPRMSQAFSGITFTGDIWELSDLDDQIEQAYSGLESISIDYAVMERSDKVQVIPVEMGWSDVGSWSALPEVVDPDEAGTVCINAPCRINLQSGRNLIYSDGRMVATVGVENLIIVSTPDALLVCDREKAQDVKKVVEELQAAGHRRYL